MPLERESIAAFEIDGASLNAGRSVDLTLGGVAPERVRIDITGAPSFTGVLACEDETGGPARAFATPKAATGDAGGAITKTIEINHTDEGQTERVRLRPTTEASGEKWRVRVTAWFWR